MAKAEEAIVRAAILSKQPIPDRIMNAPRLKDGLSLFINAFYDLDSERTYDSNTGLPFSIPFTAMVTYCNFYSIFGEDAEDMVYYVKEIDSAYVDYITNKRKKSK